MNRKKIKVDGPANMQRPFKTLWVQEFDPAAVQRFACDLAEIRLARQGVCPVIIDSDGGDVYSLFAMVDLLAAFDGPVVTIVLKAMSAGAALASCGTEGHRYVSPHATIMLHDVNDSGGAGKVEEQRANFLETQRVNRSMWTLIEANIKQPKGFLLKRLKDRSRADWYVTPREAVRLNLANHLGTPMFEVRSILDPLLYPPQWED